MNIRTRIFAGLVALLGFSAAWADPTTAECEESVATFKSVSNKVSNMIAESYGYAVFPTIGKAGLVIGGAGGAGCVFAGGKQAGTSKMGQLTVGFQAGGQAYSQIIVMQNKETFDKFTTGEFEFGAQATAVALTLSAQAESGTKGSSASAGTSAAGSDGTSADFVDGMAVFTIAKGGLMYEASIGGQKFGYKPL